MKVMAAAVVSGCEDDGGNMAAGLIRRWRRRWRYGDDGGDDLDGIVAVWWLRQQRAAKVAAAATGGRNPATAPDLLRGEGCVCDGYEKVIRKPYLIPLNTKNLNKKQQVIDR
ncbi:hypothetical protein Tco_1207523 [Tanacetum coccineum]